MRGKIERMFQMYRIKVINFQADGKVVLDKIFDTYEDAENAGYKQ